MAVVKFKFHKQLNRAVEYVTKDRGEEDVTSSLNCEFETAAEQFKMTKARHGKSGNQKVFEMIQSFNPAESKKKTPQEFHALGRKLAESLFPGFEAVIRTHTDKEHVHTHIRINTVHPDTGVRISNERQWGQFFGPPKVKEAMDRPENAKFAAVYNWSKEAATFQRRMVHVIRSESDRIVKEAGLSIIGDQPHTREEKMPEKVRDIRNARKESWILDLQQKGKFARSLSTSYDEYSGYMKEMGIDVRVEKKNVVYSIPGKQRRIVRGNKLGDLFDKEGLERNFAHNDLMFKNRPELRNEIPASVNSSSFGGHSNGDSGAILLGGGRAKGDSKKDYSTFTPTSRSGRHTYRDPEFDLSESIVPISEIRRAKGSIFEYCKKHKIELSTGKDGRSVLKGREHVVISEFLATNTRNGVSGSLIDFVRIHQNLTFLQAVSKINNNPRLLLLEKYFGEHKATFNAFYIPKSGQKDHASSEKHVSNFFRSLGGSNSSGKHFFDKGQVQVSKSGSIRIFAEGDGSGASEFTESGKNAWSEKRLGKTHQAFFRGTPNGKSVSVFLNPKSFIQKHGSELFSKGHEPKGVLALLHPEPEAIEHFLSKHHQVSKVKLVTHQKSPSKEELDFFGVLQKRYAHLGLDFSIGHHEPKAYHRGQDLEL